jgi:hypothetical protein
MTKEEEAQFDKEMAEGYAKQYDLIASVLEKVQDGTTIVLTEDERVALAWELEAVVLEELNDCLDEDEDEEDEL